MSRDLLLTIKSQECRQSLSVTFFKKCQENYIIFCKLDLVGAQEVRWGKGGTEPTNDYTSSNGNWNAHHYLETSRFSVHKGAIEVAEGVKG
jgi:hypothetical protein